MFSFVLSQKRQFFLNFFGEDILKIITSVPETQRFFQLVFLLPTSIRLDFISGLLKNDENPGRKGRQLLRQRRRRFNFKKSNSILILIFFLRQMRLLAILLQRFYPETIVCNNATSSPEGF
jgi:hypothetical protein